MSPRGPGNRSAGGSRGSRSPWGKLDPREVVDSEPLADDAPPPRILARPDHSVSRKLVDPNALKVLRRLHSQGFKGYLVGGSVRDLMLGRKPKDFDVSTDAQPNQIRRLFRNARIIGRRFRLAHILFADSMVEVATFRRVPDPKQQKGGPDDLLITSDNTFGTPREDAFRRDFTVNGLFYDIADFSVIDYVGGIEDLQQQLIRVIGVPEVRFREDPVRMLRACEFAGRLSFGIERRTQEGIYASRRELLKAAKPRLTEELLQLLKSAHSGATMQWLLELGLLEVLLPEVLSMLQALEQGAGDFNGILPLLDRYASDGRVLPDEVLLGALLLPHLMLGRFVAESRSGCFMPAADFSELVADTLEDFSGRFSLPNLKRTHLQQALEGLHRLCSQRWSSGQRLRFAGRSFFDFSLALFTILVEATGEGEEELELWRQAARQRPRRPPPPTRPRRRSRGRRRPPRR